MKRSMHACASLAACAVFISCCGRGESPPRAEGDTRSAFAEAAPVAGAPAPETGPAMAMEGGAAAPAAVTDEDKAAMTAKEVAAMQEQLGNGFKVKGKFPFAVGGDISSAHLDRFMERTIFAAYDAFYSLFMSTRPDRTMRVYLFADDESYRSNCWRLWRDKPSTPYGFYSPARCALIMNIGTGGGTLVHEMVHALMHFDFDESPTWFDEGFASLFEQCTIEHGRIIGLENWRLPILEKGIAEKRTLPLRKLMQTTRDRFLDDELSLHYAQARYFVMYVQEQGLLQDFYKGFRADFGKDPTGIATAEKVFGKNIEEVEAEMLDWVKTIEWR